MPQIARLGDRCSGHGCFPSRPNDQASSNVLCNNKGIHRKTDHWTSHCCVGCHDSVLAEGSNTVIINGLECGRIGDPVACGSSVMQGSSNTFAGG